MKTQHQNPNKLKTHPRPIFSCSFFRHCTQPIPSPTTPSSPSLPLSPPPPPSLSPPPPPPPPQPPTTHKPFSSSSSSSSSSTSQSFTQWKFPLTNSPLHPYQSPVPQPEPGTYHPVHSADLEELFHAAELRFLTGSESDQLSALYLLERSLVPNPPADPLCPAELMSSVVASLRKPAGAKPATKIILALCLAEGNRRVAVEAGAVGTVVEVAMELEGSAAERALAALELTCTVAEGAAELRSHALAVPVMVSMMGKMSGRGREYAISALGVIYCNGSGGAPGEQIHHAPPDEVARAVELALQGDCTARGRRKGTQVLKCLQDYGRSDRGSEEANER